MLSDSKLLHTQGLRDAFTGGWSHPPLTSQAILWRDTHCGERQESCHNSLQPREGRDLPPSKRAATSPLILARSPQAGGGQPAQGFLGSPRSPRHCYIASILLPAGPWQVTQALPPERGSGNSSATRACLLAETTAEPEDGKLPRL